MNDFQVDGVRYEVLEGICAELVAGDLSLHRPEAAIDGEDSVTEKLMEDVVVAATSQSS